MLEKRRRVPASIITAALLVPGAAARAAPLAVYGGPTYDGATDTGYSWAGTYPDHIRYPNVPGRAVNDAGTAVGYAWKFDLGAQMGTRAIRWDASGTPATELGNLATGFPGEMRVEVHAINDAGVAAGYATKREGDDIKGLRAVRWDASGTAATELDALGTDSHGDTQSRAYAINGAGTTVGYAITYEAGEALGDRAVRWDASGTAATQLGDLGTLPWGTGESCAYAINDSGTAVGYAMKYGDRLPQGYRAVRWDASGTAATELGGLGLSASGYSGARALAINDAGTAVGFARKYDGGASKGNRAVRWDASGTAATELGNLGTAGSGVAETYACDINASGTVIGFAEKHDGNSMRGYRAVRWDASGTAATELGHLGTDRRGFAAAYAWAINDSGTAVGTAVKYEDSGRELGLRAVCWDADGAAVDLNTLIDPNGGWLLTKASSISNTGWIAGVGAFDPDGAGGLDAYDRLFLVRVPEPASMWLLVVGALAGTRRRRRVA